MMEKIRENARLPADLGGRVIEVKQRRPSRSGEYGPPVTVKRLAGQPRAWRCGRDQFSGAIFGGRGGGS
jgi:hypothetical protein